MQKILIVHNHYRIPGGEDVVAENEAELLKAHGHEVYRYERSNDEPVGKLIMAAESIYSLRTYREVRRLIRDKGIDIVHVHNTLHRISPSVYYAALDEGVPVVQTMHNFRLLCPAGTFFCRGRVCEDCARKGAVCALKRRCYRGSLLQTAVVTASNAIHFRSGIYGKLNFICLTEFNRKKLSQLPVGKCFVKANFTQPGMKKACEDFYLVLGRIERMKGSALIAKAFARCGRRLVFAGDGEQEEALKRFINQRQLTNIECRGRLAHEDAMELLSCARALIVAPQWYETFGMGVIEAFARGVPVIAADFGNPGLLVKDGITGVKFKNNVPGLLKALDRFETLDRDTLSRNALKEFEEKYSPEVNYRKLKEIYDSL